MPLLCCSSQKPRSGWYRDSVTWLCTHVFMVTPYWRNKTRIGINRVCVTVDPCTATIFTIYCVSYWYSQTSCTDEDNSSSVQLFCVRPFTVPAAQSAWHTPNDQPLTTQKTTEQSKGKNGPHVLTSPLDGGEWSASCSSCSIPSDRTAKCPLNRWLGMTQSWSGCFE